MDQQQVSPNRNIESIVIDHKTKQDVTQSVCLWCDGSSDRSFMSDP